ncbi:protein of unknown function [Pseudomonas sp. JV241A]|nr:protein of unknown function [Pseudomonas sp. JV241A]
MGVRFPPDLPDSPRVSGFLFTGFS